MSTGWKIAIVSIVVVAIAAVIISKRSGSQGEAAGESVEVADTPASQTASSGAGGISEPAQSVREEGPAAEGTPDSDESADRERSDSTDASSPSSRTTQEKPDAERGEKIADTPDKRRAGAEDSSGPSAALATQEPEAEPTNESGASARKERTDSAISSPAGDEAGPDDTQKSARGDAAKQLPRFVEVGRETCMPCKMMQPVLDKLRQAYSGELKVEFANLDETPQAAEKYDVRTIPTQIIYDSTGEEVFRHVGFWAKKEIDKKLKELEIIE